MEDALTPDSSSVLKECRVRTQAPSSDIALKFHVRSFVSCKLLKKKYLILKEIVSMGWMIFFVLKIDFEKLKNYFRLFLKFNRLMAWKKSHNITYRRHYRLCVLK